MMAHFSISAVHPLVRATYVLSSMALVLGVMSISVSPQLALVPSALIFGWAQIGGA